MMSQSFPRDPHRSCWISRQRQEQLPLLKREDEGMQTKPSIGYPRDLQLLHGRGVAGARHPNKIEATLTSNPPLTKEYFYPPFFIHNVFLTRESELHVARGHDS